MSRPLKPQTFVFKVVGLGRCPPLTGRAGRMEGPAKQSGTADSIRLCSLCAAEIFFGLGMDSDLLMSTIEPSKI